MGWKRLAQVQNVPTSQAALALGVVSLGQAWALYIPSIGTIIRPYLAALGALCLLPVLIKYILSIRTFINDIRDPLTGSLMAPMSMALFILCDYLAAISPSFAYPLWFTSLLLHLTMMILFFIFQLTHFKISNIVPSWFLYPVGIISGSLAGTQFGHTLFSENLVMICICLYFFMLPVVLYRLMFEKNLPKRAKPTLAIMAAPINLTLATYLVNFSEPDPILTGALAGIAITMTLFIYLCYVRLLKLKFQPSISAVAFPSVVSSIAMYRLTDFFNAHHPQWYWLHTFGFFELTVATGLVIWVSIGYIKMYFPKLFSANKQNQVIN